MVESPYSPSPLEKNHGRRQPRLRRPSPRGEGLMIGGLSPLEPIPWGGHFVSPYICPTFGGG